MSETHRYVCEELKNGIHSNKYWQYTLSGSTLTIEFGRVGCAKPTVKPKTFPNDEAARREGEKQAYKKMNPSGSKNAYVAVDEEELGDKVTTAQALGDRNKIFDLQFISEIDGKKIHFGDEYNSSKGVFVTIINSWSKDKSYLRVTRNDADQYNVVTFQAGDSPDWVKTGSSRYTPEHNFVNGIRTQLQRLVEQIAEVIQTVTLGAVGVRMLDLDGDFGVGLATDQMAQVVEAVSKKASGISPQVIAKFAALGNRALEL